MQQALKKGSEQPPQGALRRGIDRAGKTKIVYNFPCEKKENRLTNLAERIIII
jgi:hypothetical protein